MKFFLLFFLFYLSSEKDLLTQQVEHHSSLHQQKQIREILYTVQYILRGGASWHKIVVVQIIFLAPLILSVWVISTFAIFLVQSFHPEGNLTEILCGIFTKTAGLPAPPYNTAMTPNYHLYATTEVSFFQMDVWEVQN